MCTPQKVNKKYLQISFDVIEGAQFVSSVPEFFIL